MTLENARRVEGRLQNRTGLLILSARGKSVRTPALARLRVRRSVGRAELKTHAGRSVPTKSFRANARPRLREPYGGAASGPNALRNETVRQKTESKTLEPGRRT